MIISHRGNLEGPNPKTENTNEQIEKAIRTGFLVEVDVWGIEGDLWLGHDRPMEKCNIRNELVYHCKDINAAEFCSGQQLHFFMHEIDKRVLTSQGFFWTFPNQALCQRSIACLPELYPKWEITGAAGICTDFPNDYKKILPLYKQANIRQ